MSTSPAPTSPTVSSSFAGKHPIAWAILVGLGLLFSFGVGFIRGLVELGGRPTTAEGWGVFTGAALGPLIMACLGAGIYYAIRKTRRTARRVISAIVAWTVLLSFVSFEGAVVNLGRSPHWPSDEQEFGRITGQAYKEASGAVPPEQYSMDALTVTMREMFRDLMQFNRRYQQALGQLDTPEMSNLYGASSFGNRATVQETVRQLHRMESVEQQFSSLDSVFAKTEARIQQKDWPEHTKSEFIAGMRQSLAQTTETRLAVFRKEEKWIEASLDLYTFAFDNLSAISIRRNQVVIRDKGTRENFNQKLTHAVELHQQVLDASKQYERGRATDLKKYGLSPSDLGLK